MRPELDLSVSGAEAGTRLDLFLGKRLELTRGYVRRLLARGGIRLNDEDARKGVRVQAGDVLRVPRFRHPREGPIPGDELELTILREDGGLIAINKPAGVPTHPLDYDETGTVVNTLLARHPEMVGVGDGGLLSGMVHRLDLGTSGALVFATAQDPWERARKAFAERRVFKRYVARVHGSLREPTEVAFRLEHRGPRMRVVARGGRAAITRVEPGEAGGETTRVEAYPVTGLMHQIRVTLAHLGHPIVGDRLYGSDRELDRILLHSAEIEIEGFRAAAPVPSEIAFPT